MDQINLCGLTFDEIFGIAQPLGFSKEAALKLTNGLYKKGKPFTEISGIKEILKTSLKERANPGLFCPVHHERSADGTVKYLFSTTDGRKFETVYIPDGPRHTVCVSSQSGCRMGCPFCVTGQYGFHGNLSAGEIVNQVISIPEASEVTHVVFMGMGEPLDNLDNVLKACDILTAEWGKAIGVRNITVSSVGIMPALQKFLQLSGCNLAVSLFSPFAEERARIVPAEKKYPVHQIIKLMKEFQVKKRRRLTFSYVMIKDLNDTENHLFEIRRLLKDSAIRINLLPYHQANGDKFRPSPDERMQMFRHELVTSGIDASIRKSRGADISAACGLLASGLK